MHHSPITRNPFFFLLLWNFFGQISVQSLGKGNKEGYLTKCGGTIKTWKKRWFVLKGDTLFYFKTQKVWWKTFFYFVIIFYVSLGFCSSKKKHQDTDLTGSIPLETDSECKEEKVFFFSFCFSFFLLFFLFAFLSFCFSFLLLFFLFAFLFCLAFFSASHILFYPRILFSFLPGFLFFAYFLPFSLPSSSIHCSERKGKISLHSLHCEKNVLYLL